ncbi:hypothetical protein SEA_LUCHADOR_97 [Mycobacterium phage Luchador]|uniref:Uncharacterized protein n=1 Tax=Mycobacterium phage Luchador TaxID=1647300 RepID=A0A0F6YRN9_9CAUD|nr:hypothetical protein AVT52_gp07 [Mycobacterium phage Luchador]AKF14261.1 hypothetical protein SEA_LUCHADOR_97 [Mycobacterium phage Luchador]
MHEHREVRVTPRKSIRQDFIAPDLSPVRTVDRELDKGLKGWTDFETKVPDMGLVDGGKERAAAEEFDRMTVGTVSRKVPAASKARVAIKTGPSDHYRAMQLRAAKLAVRS